MLIYVVCILDIVNNSTTGMVNEHDVIVMDAAVVRRDYLRDYLAFDLASSVTFDLFFFAAGCLPSQSYNMTRHPLKMLKVLHITKLFRMRHASRYYLLIKSFADPLEDRMSFRITDGVVNSCDYSCLRCSCRARHLMLRIAAPTSSEVQCLCRYIRGASFMLRSSGARCWDNTVVGQQCCVEIGRSSRNIY
jgi:hypothetical protein